MVERGQRLKHWISVSLGATFGAVTSLAVNQASAASRWPGPLDVVRSHPWWAVGPLVLASAAVPYLRGRREDRLRASGTDNAPLTVRAAEEVPPEAPGRAGVSIGDGFTVHGGFHGDIVGRDKSMRSGDT